MAVGAGMGGAVDRQGSCWADQRLWAVSTDVEAEDSQALAWAGWSRDPSPAVQGTECPQARDLAAFGVNRNTVLRALRLLRNEGLIEMARRRTIRVPGTPEQNAVIARTRDLIDFERRRGYSQDEVIAIIHGNTDR
jgi:GntR family transcriptional regulator